MYIGNIITASKLDLGKRFNVVKKNDDTIPGIPTLVVGRRKALRLLDGKLKVSNKQIDENTFWTYSSKESRIDYDKDLETFLKLCYTKTCEGIDYLFVDLIQYNSKTLKRIFRKIYGLTKPKAYIHGNDMVYIYGDGIIFGVDLQLFTFLGLDSNKIKTKIQALCGGSLLGSEILIEYKDYLSRLNYGTRFIPYLYFNDHE